jgi:tetratricopeptide (TPR) repeat protein
MRLLAAISIFILLAGGIYMMWPHDNVAAPSPPTIPPMVQQAVVPPPAPVSDASSEQHILTGEGIPAAITDIDQIAALMPTEAQVPLPTPPVKVGAGNSQAATQQRARQLQAQGASAAALRIYEQAGDDFASRVNKWGLIAESDAQRALPQLKALARERPDNAAARAQLGLALIKVADMDRALTELTTASSLAPTNAQIWYNLAVLADQMGNMQLAGTAYENALLNAGDAQVFDRASVQRRLNYLRGR